MNCVDTLTSCWYGVVNLEDINLITKCFPFWEFCGNVVKL